MFTGSSPLAWGKARSYVGSLLETMRAVHPHWRGEKSGKIEHVVLWIGSSPLAWGKESLEMGLRPLYRFIPTGVGKSA